MIVEKLDGSLWALSRIESGYNGGVEQAFSYDDGKTWTTLEGDLPYPLQGPGSRFQIYRLSSGALIWISHDTTKARTALTAWLSEDDGETWPYKLLLDDRANLSYPDITQDDNGLICVIYDKGRSKEQEIRLAMFTEDDVRAGAFVTENALERVAVTKTGGYTDILYFEEQFDQTYSVADQRELDNGYHAARKAYIEVISYNKLLADARKRNQIFFDKLFSPIIDSAAGKNNLR